MRPPRPAAGRVRCGGEERGEEHVRERISLLEQHPVQPVQPQPRGEELLDHLVRVRVRVSG